MIGIPKPQIFSFLPQEGACFIEAHAGTGKTYTIERLAVNFILKGIPLENILIVTFTNKAAIELKLRIREIIHAFLTQKELREFTETQDTHWIIGEQEEKYLQQALLSFDIAHIFTIHSFCQRVLKEYVSYFGEYRPIENTSSENLYRRTWKSFLRKHLREDSPYFKDIILFSQDYPLWESTLLYGDNSLYKIVSSSFSKYITYGENILKTKRQLSEIESFIYRILPEFSLMFHQLKKEENLSSFDDLILETKKILTLHEYSEYCCKSLQKQYQAALIDEFQDTDSIQWDIFKTLFLTEEKKPFFLIGDPKQSIYRFRGADLSVYFKALESVGAKVSLQKNYRSTADMISSYNTIFKQDDLFSPFHQDLTSLKYLNPAEHSGNKDHSFFINSQKQKAITILEVRQENNYFTKDIFHKQINISIVNEIERIIAYGYIKKEDENIKISYSDIFILFRKNKDAEEILKLLRSHGIPAILSSDQKLFTTQEAQDILYILKALKNPGNRTYLFTALTTPFFNLLPQELVTSSEATNHWTQKFYEWSELTHTENIGQLIYRIIDESDLCQRELLLNISERTITNFLHIAEEITYYISETRSNIYQLIELMESVYRGESDKNLSEKQQRIESEKDCIQVMSIHKSKGLESKIVFIMGGYTEGSMSNIDIFSNEHLSINSKDHEIVKYFEKIEKEESIRLLYVALTRASHKLYLPFIPLSIDWANKYLSKRYWKIMNDRINYLINTNSELFEIKKCDTQKIYIQNQKIYYNDEIQEDNLILNNSIHEAQLHIKNFKRIRPQSYSRLKKMLSNNHQPLSYMDEIIDDGLPRGASFGSAVHDIFENVDWKNLQSVSDFEAWYSSLNLKMVSSSLQKYFISPEFIKPICKMVYDSLRSPLSFKELKLPQGLSQVSASIRECEFLFPLHKMEGLFGYEPQISAEHQYITGFADMIFRENKQFYFLDWKTDILPQYQVSFLNQIIEDRYQLQDSLYTLALCRMLDIHDEISYKEYFGGRLYVFVRGTHLPSQGFSFSHFPWKKLKEFEKNLKEILEEISQ